MYDKTLFDLKEVPADLLDCFEETEVVCGKPWGRVVDSTYDTEGRTTNGPRSIERRHEKPGFQVRAVKHSKTLDWQPQCTCPAHEPHPCLVLDPFLGSGTTAQVARQLNRHAVGVELNAEYALLARKRSMQRLDGRDDLLPLFD